MTPREFESEPAWTLPGEFPLHEPPAECRERIRARCYTVLRARQRQPSARSVLTRRLAFDLAAAGCSAVFLAEIVRRALAVYGL